MISLRTEGLGKAYRIYRRPVDILKEMFLRRECSENFWALRDVDLEVPRGGALGIVGDNGAGKSTLLRLLAGASKPSAGRVVRSGRLSAILSLGSGFHPDLSGLENIRMGCAVLGLSPAETAAALPGIISFSELAGFIERPVRTYSSGMALRLGFSVATVVDPEILVVDEHLSVGDQHFQHKCLRRIMALRSRGCTLVFCSHNPFTLGEICDQALWLHDGKPAMLGPTRAVLDAYQDHVRARDAGVADTVPTPPQPVAVPQARSGINGLVDIVLAGVAQGGEVLTGGRLELNVVARLTESAWRDGAHVAALIVRNDGVWCHGCLSLSEESGRGLFPLEEDEYGVTLVIDSLPLLSGEYSFTVALMDGRSPHTYDHRAGACAFRVRHVGKAAGVTLIPHRWQKPQH